MITKEGEMRRDGFWRRLAGPVKAIGDEPPGLRYGTPADAAALARLAELDSSRPPRGLVLVAEVGGELWAAVSVDDGHGVADPFRPASELLLHLHARARRVRRAEKGRLHTLPRVWPAGA